MIKSKLELKFYIWADHMMNRGCFSDSIGKKIIRLFFPDLIMNYLKVIRCLSYFKNQENKFMTMFYRIKYRRLSQKLGILIGPDTFGYGLVIPHQGTILVGDSNRIGNFAVVQTSTCITDNGKNIGDAFYCATGVKVTKKVVLGNNISVGANSVVNHDFLQDNVMIAGMPAKVIKSSSPWYIRDGEEYYFRVQQVENLRKQLKL